MLQFKLVYCKKMIREKLQKNIVLRFCTFGSYVVKKYPTERQQIFCCLLNIFPVTIHLFFLFFFCIGDSICIGQEIQCILYAGFVNRPSVARAVLQTTLTLTFTDRLIEPFHPNLHNIIIPKP